MRCKVCGTRTGEFRSHSTTICKPCDNAMGRANRLESLVASTQTVDVVFPTSQPIDPLHAYQTMSAITRHVELVHSNGAVAIVIEPTAIRLRLFSGPIPCWMTTTSQRWEPLRVTDLAPVAGRTLDILGQQVTLGEPAIERLRPCRVLRIVAAQKHNQRETRQTETLRRRLLAGGVLSVVEPDGQPYMTQTGSSESKEKNRTHCTPLRIYTATKKDGFVAQTRPLGAGGRYGCGFAVALPEDHSIAISEDGLLRLGQATRALGVDGHTMQYWMRKLGFGWLLSGKGRYFDPVMMGRLRESIPSIRWRAENGARTRQLWTDEEERLVWDGIEKRLAWKEVAERVGRSYRACILKARWLRAEAQAVAA